MGPAARTDIVFLDGNCAAYGINADGTGKHLVFRTAAAESECTRLINSPGWSTDHSQLAYGLCCTNGSYDLYVRDLGSGEARRLTVGRRDDIHPRWSPDDRFIAFDVGIQHTRLKVLEVESGRVSDLTEGHFLGWAPGSQRIYLSRFRHDRFSYYVIDIRDGAVHRLGLNLPPRAYDPIFSPDGKRIVYTLQDDTPPAQEAEPGCNPVLARRDGSHPVMLTRYKAHRCDAASEWSPDGSKILFQRNDGGLYIVEVDGQGGAIAAPTFLTDGYQPDW